jgi:hypothetical protein
MIETSATDLLTGAGSVLTKLRALRLLNVRDLQAIRLNANGCHSQQATGLRSM